MGRVEALTASYTLLSRESWGNVSLHDVVLEETKPFLGHGRTAITFNGPQVLLSPQAALGLGMAIHELATNAIKYGALSTTDGIVSVSWRVECESVPAQFVLEWIETGGPEVSSPTRRGFGMQLIERGLTHELSGDVTVDFEAGGLHATLCVPLSSPPSPGSPPILGAHT